MTEGLFDALARRNRTKRSTRVQDGMMLALAGVVFGCDHTDPTQVLAIEVQTSGDTVVMDLSLSLYAIAHGAVAAEEITADLVFGNDPTNAVVHVGDVTTIDSLIVVLDRGADQIVTWSHQGEPVSRIGREGEGPGEFLGPIAVTAVSDYFIVFQPQLSNTLTIVHRSGETRSTASSPVEGDWSTMLLRGPRDMIEAPFAGGVEDWTRRLQRFDDSSFVFQVQSDELRLRTRIPEINLVRFNLDGRVLDTIWTTSGPSLHEGAAVVENQLSRWIEPLFSPRPVWTTGDGWFGFGGGEDSTLTVRSIGGTGVVVVRWPLASMRVTDEDRLARARWSGEYTLRMSATARTTVAELSERQVEREYRLHAGRLPFSDRAPEVTAVWGVDECLILSGYAPSDYADATSLTLVVVNVVEHSLVGVVRLADVDRRIRHMSLDGIFATHPDQDGAFVVERYDFSHARECGVEG